VGTVIETSTKLGWRALSICRTPPVANIIIPAGMSWKYRIVPVYLLRSIVGDLRMFSLLIIVQDGLS